MSKFKKAWINVPSSSPNSDILAKLHGVNVLYDEESNTIEPTGYKVKEIAHIILNVPGSAVLSSGWLPEH